jgi:hypothetical protein
MDGYMIKHGPNKYEVGHVGETPTGWEERYERVDGKVRQGKVCNFLSFILDMHMSQKKTNMNSVIGGAMITTFKNVMKSMALHGTLRLK